MSFTNHCITDNLDLEACINIIRDTNQPFRYIWQIDNITLAADYTLKLYDRKKNLVQSYLFPINNDNQLIWEPLNAAFTTSEMFYSIVPTVPTPEIG